MQIASNYIIEEVKQVKASAEEVGFFVVLVNIHWGNVLSENVVVVKMRCEIVRAQSKCAFAEMTLVASYCVGVFGAENW